jgi:hypothetical protein
MLSLLAESRQNGSAGWPLYSVIPASRLDLDSAQIPARGKSVVPQIARSGFARHNDPDGSLLVAGKIFLSRF